MEALLSGKRILVLAPHADDEVIGSGGLIAKVKDLGGQAYVQVITVGDLTHYDGADGTVAARTRVEELAAAMACLGVDDYEVVFENSAKHLRLDAIPRRDLVSLLEKGARLSIDRIRPDIITFPAPSYNQDHEALYKAAITACRPHLASLKPFQKLVLVADAPQLCWKASRFRPNFFVDITRYLEKKLEAFRCHRSQQRPDPHNGGIESLRLLALTRGREISIEAAEAYECLRCVV